MDHAGHRERLRQRYQAGGLSAFADHEILELLLTFAIPRVNTNDTAHLLIDRFGSLNGVLEATQEELEQVQGIGRQASTLLSMMLPLMRKYERGRLMPRARLESYADIAEYCKTLFLGKGQEEFYLISLDAEMKLLAVKCLGQGTPTEVPVLPQAVLREALRSNAVGAVLAHNHPSGRAEPSQEDVTLTQTLQQLLQSAGIRLYDHVIVSGGEAYSFFSHRWIGMPEETAPEEEEAQHLAAERPGRVLPPRMNKAPARNRTNKK